MIATRHPANTSSTPLPTLLACALLVVGAPAVLHAAKQVNRTVPASSNVEVKIECLSGQLRILGGSSSELTVTGTVGDDATLVIDGEGRRIDIEVKIPERRRDRRIHVDVDLEIRLPSGASLEIESVSITSEIEDVAGEIKVESVSGNVTVSRSRRSLSIETVSGKVRVVDAQGEIEIETVNGQIELDQISGNLNVSAVSGDVKIRDADLSGGDLETVNASVFVEGRLQPEARLSIDSYSGNVELVLPPSTSASFEIETMSGRIDNRLTGDRAERTDRFGPGKTLEMVVGSGGARVTIETLSGNVVIRP